MKKVFIALMFMVFEYSSIKAQIVYTMPDMFDVNSANMFLQAQRDYIHAIAEAREVDRHVAQEVQPYLNKVVEYFNSRKYGECIDLINGVFHTFNFYTRQKDIYSPFLYYRGLCEFYSNNRAAAYSDLKDAWQCGNNEAGNFLLADYYKMVEQAKSALKRNDPTGCISICGTAQENPCADFSIYEIGGLGFEMCNDFENAKVCFKLAKKMGSPNAKELLKDLKNKMKSK